MIQQITTVNSNTLIIDCSPKFGKNLPEASDLCNKVAAIQEPNPTILPAERSVPFVIKQPLTPVQ